MLEYSCDIAIIGSGFGGSMMAMICRRLGLEVVLLERGKHPRFAIGESTSPLMNLLIEQLSDQYDLPNMKPLASYGTWMEQCPHVMRGLKRGFTYYSHEAGKAFVNASDRSDQLLVAASPNNRLADTHWLRADVDAFLTTEAEAVGVVHLQGVKLVAFRRSNDTNHLTGTHEGEGIAVASKLIIDASGVGGFLSKQIPISIEQFVEFPETHGLFTHFTGVKQMSVSPLNGSPYPPDSAALHHVFEGGWMWVLPFDNGVTSAGIAVESWLAGELKLQEGAAAWERFLARFPTIRSQFDCSTPILPFIHQAGMAKRASIVTGDGWVLLPSAAGFIDPLFSTGMPLTLLGIERLAIVLRESWDRPEMQARLVEYGATTQAELTGTAKFIEGCYSAMGEFDLFTTYSMFYFAAASFSEMARRLNTNQVSRYLAMDNKPFYDEMCACAEWLKVNASTPQETERHAFQARVKAAIEPLNIAGLCDAAKLNWYGVDLNDVVTGASKLGFTPSAMEKILAKADWAR